MFLYLFLGFLLLFGILELCFIFYMIYQEYIGRKKLIQYIRENRKINIIIKEK